jgi:hypothetical protein
MRHAIIRDGNPVELSTRDWWVDAEGFTHSPRALILWTPEQLSAKDVHPIVEPVVPEGERVVDSVLVWDGEAVTREVTTEVIPPQSEEEVAANVRRERDASLRDSDWTQLLDAPVDQEEWAAYRANLRSLPEQPGFPYEVEWPAAPWLQPQGAHDAYAEGARVTHAGKVWVSLMDANVWEPGVTGWREETASGEPAAWVQPTGAHDAYGAGDTVTHNGQTWVSDIDANVWEPGVHGWSVIP